MERTIERQDIILELMIGERIETSLTRPFVPDQNEIITAAGRNGEEQVFALQEICLVAMNDIPEGVKDTGGKTEEVVTATGRHLQVRIAASEEYDTGFFGFPEQNDIPWKCIFFTYIGIRSRRLMNQAHTFFPVQAEVTFPADDAGISPPPPESEHESPETTFIIEAPEPAGDSLTDIVQHSTQDDAAPHRRAKIGDILISAGLVTQEQIESALSYQEKNRKTQLGTILVERRIVTEAQLLAALCSKFRYQFVDLDQIEPDPKALHAISVDIAKQFQVLPLHDKGDHLVIAISNPREYALTAVALQFHANRRVELVIATSAQIHAGIEKYYLQPMEDIPSQSFEDMFDEDLAIEAQEKEDPNEPRITETDSKIIRLVNKILLDGYARKASDIHIEPGPGKEPIQIRYRIDGICQRSYTVPKNFQKALISRIKIISNLDITERRKPQSGKIITKLQNRKIEFRVEITPTVGSIEDAVIRVLSTAKALSLDQMNFSPVNAKRFKQVLSKPYGIILCAGPTGSGKTTTLHSALSILNTPERKIWTAEDPVEITQPGLRQVQVQPKIGFTFAEAIRSFLRGDPDIIMIGEIRDRVTAKISVEASLTGHLVLSTLHTNSAPETVVRLIELGVEAFNFADGLLGVLAQRLVRRLCESCKKSFHPDERLYEEIIDGYAPQFLEEDGISAYTGEQQIFKQKGCNDCGGSGYNGRLAIHELLLGSVKVKAAIKKQEPAEVIRDIAIAEGMRTLKMDGTYKVFLGLTDFEQIKGACV